MSQQALIKSLHNIYKNNRRKNYEKKINLENITNEQLKAIYNANSVIREKVEEAYQENILYWIGEQLKYIEGSLSKWCIGFYQDNFIKVKNDYEFLKGLWKMEKDIPALTVEQNKELEALINKLDELEDEEVEKQSKKFQEYLINQWEKELNYDYSEKELEDYFIECEYMNILRKNMFIDENNVVYKLESFK